MPRRRLRQLLANTTLAYLVGDNARKLSDQWGMRRDIILVKRIGILGFCHSVRITARSPVAAAADPQKAGTSYRAAAVPARKSLRVENMGETHPFRPYRLPPSNLRVHIRIVGRTEWEEVEKIYLSSPGLTSAAIP